MANNEYAIRFSEDKYLTKKEVAKEMKMSIIDTIWSNVLNYRSNFYSYLPLKSIERSSLFVCLCISIQAKIGDADKGLAHLFEEEKKLSSVNGDSQYFTLSSYIQFLKEISSFRKYDVDENIIRDLINGKRLPIEIKERSLINYFNSLKYIERHATDRIDEEYVADLYAKLSGQDELISFYRVNEDTSSANKMIIDRLYNSAPVALIESLMNYLFEFLDNSSLNPVCKALITYYYIDYIKPFASFNEEAAILLAKAVLTSRYDSKATLFNLEGLLNEKENEISKYNEVQKTQDLTYFVVYGLDYTNRKVRSSIDQIYEFSSAMIKNDFYQEDKQEIKEEAAPVEEVKETPVVETHVAPTPTPEAPAVESPKEENPTIEPIKEEIKPEPVKEEVKPVEVKQTPKVIVKPEPIKEETPSGLAVSFIPPELDEKTANRLTNHLLECDPNLKKGEAYFYARHCTLGKIYTIQQYKKCLGVVYETARTSMDHLKELGYYQESMIKNKKVYTPVKR